MNPQELMAQFAGMQAGGMPVLGGSQGGSLGDVGELQKALTASNYQTDVSTLTGGGAMVDQASVSKTCCSASPRGPSLTVTNRFSRLLTPTHAQ